MIEAIFAGAACGYLMAVLTSALFARLLVASRGSGGLVDHTLAPTLSLPIISMGVFTIAFWAWPALGLLLGAVFGAVRDSGESFLGSPNIYFSLTLAAVVLPQVVAACLLMGRVSADVLALGGLVIAVFGWLMPRLTMLAD